LARKTIAEHSRGRCGLRDRFYASGGCFFVVLLLGCDVMDRPGDTTGLQQMAQWEWRGRIVVDTDRALTLVRLRIDTVGVSERHDVLIARYDYDPVTTSAGDEYALTLALDLGDARRLPLGDGIPLSAPGGIPMWATVQCLCAPLRPDSVRGYVFVRQRGLRQLTMRIDASLYFTQWNDTTQHTSYRLRQPMFGVH